MERRTPETSDPSPCQSLTSHRQRVDAMALHLYCTSSYSIDLSHLGENVLGCNVVQMTSSSHMRDRVSAWNLLASISIMYDSGREICRSFLLAFGTEPGHVGSRG